MSDIAHVRVAGEEARARLKPERGKGVGDLRQSLDVPLALLVCRVRQVWREERERALPVLRASRPGQHVRSVVLFRSLPRIGKILNPTGDRRGLRLAEKNEKQNR